ncbi:MAG: molecular chaperone HtpG [Bacteriovoracaceae bacterium]|nr:molecular chaperone HtpG [Bacteriovoracaceae bacterium]
MSERKGNISVQTNDIFPIIKKWLYSEHDIFLRELVANSTDAITKRSTWARTKNVEVPEGQILIDMDSKNKTIKIHDNGIGMTEGEVEKYIAQLAFSGAEDFVKEMKSADDASKFDIIGKFGLGFFSTFMVSSKVEVDTLSTEDGSKSVKWICEGETEYVFTESERKEIGTTVTMHMNDDGKEFLDFHKVTSSLRRFCDFMPFPITVYDVEAIKKEKKENEKKKKEEEKTTYAQDGSKINETKPLWRKDPKTISDDEYKEFFRKLYPMDPEPLFWIHLKVDHPFTLDGILYFPKLNMNKPFNESNIKLYCKQVFVSDNVKNIIPEFLSLLKGSIDSSDIPLNVSRSSLQGDPNIRRISNYIIKKVGESLKKLHKKDRQKYESIWEDIGIFIKYGCVSDTKFDEMMRDMVVYKNSENKFVTMAEYQDSVPENYKEKMKDKIIYFIKEKSDISLKKQLLTEGIHVIETDEMIDPHFMQHVEFSKTDDKNIQFSSVDSEIEKILSTENTNEEDIKIKDLFKTILVGESASDDSKEKNGDPAAQISDSMDVEIAKLKNAESPAFFRVDEQMKRYRNMARSMGQANMAFPLKRTLVINPNNTLVKNTLKIWEKGEHKDLVEKICQHVEDLACISSDGLKENEKNNFVKRSQNLIQELSQFIA